MSLHRCVKEDLLTSPTNSDRLSSSLCTKPLRIVPTVVFVIFRTHNIQNVHKNKEKLVPNDGML